ncbi:serine/threonine protein kinase [Pseudenhygromyxa sp. WMMC2535]|uniref:serine/threonine-protein kinase n=1 Tax=Pseudenhygromyxa sp. WMMC2535 TaxID=2712867 RepID=UPI0015580B89|nr:serine/threonine-protein kinase [Pseudenhygromyxa sp. WMMC2535]NVB43327.1 serine/threonine protein kinase [Pseudenhygromyxa sp. WMMC2535]
MHRESSSTPPAAQSGTAEGSAAEWSGVSVDGELPGPDSLAVEVARERVRARLLGEVERRKRVDRFSLERELGAGGMGTVWSAFDERLDRRVALKFMRAEGSGAEDEQRMVDEAKSLAKLSHPNVIPVYDVGRSEGRVWIAMELVPGRTLRRWVAEEQPPRQAILAAWLDAGRGLAAVHAAGLIHRDIKPDNVMIGADGRVRLIDFGLVRRAGSRGDEALSTAERVAAPRPSATMAKTSPSAARGFAGTPAYAAPEQLAGEAVDVRADQYAYCVSVWEGLCGARPRHSSAEQERALGRRIRRVLAKGLAARPDERFVDMDALLDALAPHRRTWVLSSALGVGLIGALAAGFAGLLGPTPAASADPCADSGRALARLWTPARREQLAAALGERSTVVETIDDWGARWSEVAAQACAEVHVEHARSEDSLDRRRACLDDRLGELEAVLGVAETPGAQGVAITRALALLDGPEGCLDPWVFRRPVIDAQQRALADSLQAQLAAAWAGQGLAEVDARRRQVADIVEAARGGGLGGLEVRAALVACWMAVAAGDFAGGRRWIGEALDRAEGRGDPELLARSWNAFGIVALEDAIDLELARWAGSREAASVEPLGEGDPRRAEAARQRARVLAAAGDFDAAEREARVAVAGYQKAGPESAWSRAAALRTLAELQGRRGHEREAIALQAEASALEQDWVGANAAGEARGEALLADGLNALDVGALDEAEDSLERALVQLEREFGPRGRNVAMAHIGLGTLADARGELEREAAHYREADGILRQLSGPLDFDRYYTLTALGTLDFRLGRFDAAAASYERALRVAEAHMPAEGAELATARMNLGEALLELGAHREAERLLLAALDGLRASLGPRNDSVAIAYKGLGAARLAVGDAEAARGLLERSLDIHLELGVNLVEQAETRRLLVESLVAVGEGREAAAQARVAIAEFEALGSDWGHRVKFLRETLETTDNDQKKE